MKASHTTWNAKAAKPAKETFPGVCLRALRALRSTHLSGTGVCGGAKCRGPWIGFGNPPRLAIKKWCAFWVSGQNLKQHGDATLNVNIASLLDQIDNCLVESAFRDAGFVVGFEVCRHLLLGELDLAALKASGDEADGGAR